MFDAALQMRFWRNVTEALTHSTDAAFAAAAIWQNEMLAAGKEQPPARPQSSFLMPFWPMNLTATDTRKSSGSSLACFAPWAVANDNSAFAMMAPWADLYRQSFSWMAPNGPCAQWAKMFAPYFPWPAMTWAYMQTPLTAMLVSQGMPYTVAAPSAKASTCAMDAADAAREQMENVYAAYRTDGGHAAAQLVMLPWALAASFMTAAKVNAPSSSKVH